MSDSTPLNIRQFNVLTLMIVSELYRTFPKPRPLHLNQLAASVTPEDASFEESHDWISASSAAADWLQIEGFIRFERRTHVHSRPGDVEEAQLTLKGLTTLGYVPDALSIKPKSSRITLIDRINGALSTGAREVGAEAIKELTKELIQAAIKSTP